MKEYRSLSQKKNWLFKAGKNLKKKRILYSIIDHFRVLNDAKESYEKLFCELKQLQEKYEQAMTQSLSVSQELSNTKRELEELLKEKQEEYTSYQSQLEEIKQ